MVKRRLEGKRVILHLERKGRWQRTSWGRERVLPGGCLLMRVSGMSTFLLIILEMEPCTDQIVLVSVEL